jgi:hypothetical protein
VDNRSRNSLGLFLRHPRTSIQWYLADRKNVPPWQSRAYGSKAELRDFARRMDKNLKLCTWTPHPQYSVFTQYDQKFYLSHKEEFLHKYKCFYAVSKTISARRIIELGMHAGAGADAYLSGSPGAAYVGIDAFETGPWFQGVVHEITGAPWRPREVAESLFQSRGFTNYELVQANLRELRTLPYKADFVIVDGAHDFDNQYADLKLALTAEPEYIFVDDSDDENQAKPAIEAFLSQDVAGRVSFIHAVSYIGGGLVIKLRK